MIALSVIVMFRNPGPDTSMSLITSPVTTRSTTPLASSRGLAFVFFASARIPLAWKSARSLRRSRGSTSVSAPAAAGRAAVSASARRWWT